MAEENFQDEISQSEKKDKVDTLDEDGEVHSESESGQEDGKKLASVIVDNRSRKENCNVVFIGYDKSSIKRKIMSLMRTTAENEKSRSDKDYFETEHKHFNVLGTSERNQAELAVFVVSARKKDFEDNFDRHERLYDYYKLEGMKHLVVLIDNMDDKSVKWDEKVFNEYKDKIVLCLKKLTFKNLIFIPCSVRSDIGVRKPVSDSICSWYKGPAFIPYIDKILSLKRQAEEKEEDRKDDADVDAGAGDTNPKARISERERRTVDLLTSRTGGAYIPPAKLRLLQAEITDKSSAAYQRIAWEALKKTIHGYINKVNVFNIAIITRELLKENIVRGRGLLCRSIIQAQTASPTFTHVYAALVAIINSKFPNIGELLLHRLIYQFKRAFRRNDKSVCLSASRFIAHLVNQRVAHEILALELLTLLVEKPTDDSVEVAIAFLKECGMKLTEVSSKGVGAIFEMLKNILHEGKLEKRVQYMIEVIFQVRKDGFKDHQSIIEKLELVEEDDQFTHLIMIDETNDPQDILNVFKFDDKYEANEGIYKGLSKEILGSDSDGSGSAGSGSNSNSDSDDGSSNSDDEEDEDTTAGGTIIDNTETNLIALRRTIYLTINSSLDYEECAHKLMKLQLKPGQEIELCHMFLDCCAEQRTYEKFFGLLAQRFCSINKIYIEPFEEIFRDTFKTTHRLDTNRLRNVSKFFAHLLFTDAISWDVLECIKLNEDDTTSSSRIFIKILFQELAEYMGLAKLNAKLKDEVLTESLAGLFPKDNPRNTRFSINFFTSIGLGGLTDELRQFLKTAPKSVSAINADILVNKAVDVKSSSSSSNSSDSDSSSSSSSSSSSDSSDDSSSSSTSSDSSSDSSEDEKTKRKKKKKTSESHKKVNSKVMNNKKNKRKKRDTSSSESSSDDNSSNNSRNVKECKRIKHENLKEINKNRKKNGAPNDDPNIGSKKYREIEKSRKHEPETIYKNRYDIETEKENSRHSKYRERESTHDSRRERINREQRNDYRRVSRRTRSRSHEDEKRYKVREEFKHKILESRQHRTRDGSPRQHERIREQKEKHSVRTNGSRKRSRERS